MPSSIRRRTESFTRGCFRRIRSRLAREFLTELTEKHDVTDAVFLIDDADDLIGGLRKEGLSYRIQPHGYRN